MIFGASWDGNSAASQRSNCSRKLDQTGSINSAAKAIGLSYKSAWQKLERLNNIVPYPLLSKKTGGSGGGGTELTEEGRQLLRHIKLLEKELSQFVEFFSGNPGDAMNTLKTLRRLKMKISARNVWVGQVVTIDEGVVNRTWEYSAERRGQDKFCDNR